MRAVSPEPWNVSATARASAGPERMNRAGAPDTEVVASDTVGAVVVARGARTGARRVAARWAAWAQAARSPNRR